MPKIILRGEVFVSCAQNELGTHLQRFTLPLGFKLDGNRKRLDCTGLDSCVIELPLAERTGDFDLGIDQGGGATVLDGNLNFVMAN